MSFSSMAWELQGSVPKIDLNLCYTYVNRAWRIARDSSLWSFQLFETGIYTPGLIGGTSDDNVGNSSGTVTVVQGSTEVVGDTIAATAWNAQTFPPITLFQFRVQGRSIYNVIAFDGTDTITLDRPFLEPSGASQLYQMYQCYYAAPYKDFKRWMAVRDMYNGFPLNILKPRKWIDERDPLRLYFSNPTVITAYEQDQRGAGTDNASGTLGYMLFEMYPSPTGQLTYQAYGIRNGADLQNSADELPTPMTEDCILERAKVDAYKWAEANKDAIGAKGAAPNFMALSQASMGLYQQRVKELRLEDRETVDNFLAKVGGGAVTMEPYYNTVTGRGYAGQ